MIYSGGVSYRAPYALSEKSRILWSRIPNLFQRKLGNFRGKKEIWDHYEILLPYGGKQNSVRGGRARGAGHERNQDGGNTIKGTGATTNQANIW